MKDIEVKTLQEDLAKAKQDIFEKDKLLKESLANQELLTQLLKSTKNSLIDAKYIIWDHLLKEVKKLKDYFIQVEDEQQLATSCLANLLTLQENLGDKPLQAQNAINFLNSRTKTQLHFAGIEDRADLIAQARKYIIKDRLLKDMSAKANYLLRRVDDFKIIFKDVFEQGLPNFWNEQVLFLSDTEYQVKFLEKRNDLFDINQLTVGIKGQDIFDILENDFYLLFMMRQTINGLLPVTYSFYSELDAISREMLAMSFPANPTWQRILMFVSKWIDLENSSSALVPIS